MNNKKGGAFAPPLHGAGEGNRTLDASLGSSNFTIKLHLQIDIEIMYVIILRMAELVK